MKAASEASKNFLAESRTFHYIFCFNFIKIHTFKTFLHNVKKGSEDLSKVCVMIIKHSFVIRIIIEHV